MTTIALIVLAFLIYSVLYSLSGTPCADIPPSHARAAEMTAALFTCAFVVALVGTFVVNELRELWRKA